MNSQLQFYLNLFIASQDPNLSTRTLYNKEYQALLFLKYLDSQDIHSKILSSVFNALLPNPIFRKVMPSEYKLFQVADLLCTMELVRLKYENNLFSKSEMIFFRQCA